MKIFVCSKKMFGHFFFYRHCYTSATTFVVPGSSITNGLIRARIYLPDADKWILIADQGSITAIPDLPVMYWPTANGTLNMLRDDAIMGPGWRFPIQAGFKFSKTGREVFLKIGYRCPWKAWHIRLFPLKPPLRKFLNGGKWKVKTNEASVGLQHTLNDTALFLCL